MVTSKKRPLWKWILLFFAAFLLSTLGYGMLMAGYEVSERFWHPSVTILWAVTILGLYALFVKLMEGHWPTDLNLRHLVPTPCWVCS